MFKDFLKDKTALSGGMIAEERETFELLLKFHGELREFVAGLVEVGASPTLANLPAGPMSVAASLKARIFSQIANRPQHLTPEGIVVCSADRLVEWVNPAFTNMCGCSLDELRGKSLGPILQGAGTDRVTAEQMRQAVHVNRPCRETMLNYYKNGTPYWIEVAITPFLDEAGQPLWIVARERELTDRFAA